MFGENFFNRITHKEPGNPDSNAHNTVETPYISELIDTLDTEINRNGVDLARQGIDANIVPFFTMSIEDHDDESSMSTVDHGLSERTDSDDQSIFTCAPRSAEDLRDILHTHYRGSFDTTKIRASLLRRNIDASRHDTVIDQLFDHMVDKTVTTFTADITRRLTDAGLSPQQAQAYFSWRFSTLSPDDTLTVTHTPDGERVAADNFVSESRIAEFLEQYGTRSDNGSDPRHFTSDDIDDLIERALNE
jgi:hypothetical protein